MASALDVADYILKKIGSTSSWKLQKLVYYSQAWHLVWEDAPLFNERIEAWANGPVSPALYEKHKGGFTVETISGGNAKKLAKKEKEAIDTVIKFYGEYSGQQLSDLTHSEDPWLNARDGLAATERGNREITLEAMSEYYTSL